MNTARYIKDIEGMNGHVEMFEFNPPIEGNQFAIVSAIVSAFDTRMPETYIFACDSEGKILGWSELDGSYCGGTSIDKALRNAGYVRVTNDPGDSNAF